MLSSHWFFKKFIFSQHLSFCIKSHFFVLQLSSFISQPLVLLSILELGMSSKLFTNLNSFFKEIRYIRTTIQIAAMRLSITIIDPTMLTMWGRLCRVFNICADLGVSLPMASNHITGRYKLSGTFFIRLKKRRKKS